MYVKPVKGQECRQPTSLIPGETFGPKIFSELDTFQAKILVDGLVLTRQGRLQTYNI